MEVGIMAQNLKAWLAAIPPESEIDGRISEVESELELLRAIKQVRVHAPTAEPAEHGAEPTSPSKPQPASEPDPQNGSLPPEVEALKSRLSPVRIRILRAIFGHRNRATIPDVVAVLGDPDDRDNIASNMQRMVKAKLLSRTGRGTYALTRGAAQLVRSMPEEMPEPASAAGADPQEGRLL
jgi:hypothetical protein